jgi:signal transduction histidine kinase
VKHLSIRARLTLLVTLAALGVGVLAATIGIRTVERALIGSRLDGYVDSIVDSWDTQFTPDDDTASADGESAIESLAILDANADTDLARDINGQLRRDAGEPIVVAVPGGGFLTVDGSESRAIAADDVPGPAIVTWDLDEIAGILDGQPTDSSVTYSTQVRRLSGVDVLIGYETTDLAASIDAGARAMRWLVPAFVGLAGGLTWLVASAALRPVSKLTTRVADIAAQGPLSGERVEVPTTRDEIAALAQRMNEMLDRVGSSAVAQRVFTADASHELRSPLAVLRSEHEQAAATGDDLAERSLPEIERLERVVDDLLDLTRSDERRARPALPVDLDDIVLAESTRHRRVAVDVTAVGAGQVLGDRERLRRVVQHLLDNAARHAHAHVKVALMSVNGEVQLTVDDDGPGIPADQRQRVFERFVRLDHARQRDRGGAGLGLSVVAEIVADHGGRVAAVDSALGGVRFEVSLPTS